MMGKSKYLALVDLIVEAWQLVEDFKTHYQIQGNASPENHCLTEKYKYRTMIDVKA